MSRSAASPRVLQLYSPRRPSPLGLPPLAPHMGFQDMSCTAYPKTPERYYVQHSEPTSHGMRFPPEVHRPLGSNTQRARAPPPAPLSLDTQHHPAVLQLPSIEHTFQPHATQEMCVPPSTSPSSSSSLSSYSFESAKKSSQMGVILEEEEGEERKKAGGFCLCFNFSALFGTKSKPNKIQEPVVAPEPAPAPQMVHTRRRPPSLVLVR